MENKNDKIQVGIVIVNYNGAKYQNDCIDSIIKSDYKNFKIIVVDNGSTDKSMDLLEQFDDERIFTIKNNFNYGVAKGNNIGIKKSIELNCDVTLLLNNDTVLDKSCISSLVKEIKNGEKIVVPTIFYYGTEKIWYGGGGFSKLKCIGLHYNQGKTLKECKFNQYYDYSPTCCMLIDNAVFSEIGLMDENYFMYFDDTDFCFRAKLANIKIKFCEESVLYHKVSLATGGEEKVSKIREYYGNRNRFYFYKKYKKHFSIFSYLFLILTRRYKYLKGVIKKNDYKIIKRAIKDYKHNKMGGVDNL